MGWAWLRMDECAVVDIAELDAQHQQLFRLLDRLEENVTQGPDAPATLAAVADLVQYANQHFFHEESLMRMLGYPEYEAHVADHNRLRDELDEFRLGAFNANVAGELLELFRIRFSDHIEMMDRQYAPHFLNTQIQTSRLTFNV